MSFASLNDASVDAVVRRYAEAGDVTLLVGAGASMEADLPSWPALLRRLLTTVAADVGELRTADARRAWVDRTLEREDLLGAAAVVEVMAATPLEELVPRELYGRDGPGAYAPGPIAEQVAFLRERFGDRLEILTTNYDELIEQALVARGVPRSRLRSYVRALDAGQRARDAVAVTHLHGLAGRGGAREIVLTEEHYQRMQLGRSWQEQLVTERLERSLCLFVGTSLTDPNLIRYLYGYEQAASRRHAAIFVRQSEAAVAPEVRAAREVAAARRWGRCGVDAVFVDHYADAAQLLYEIGHRRDTGGAYEPIGARAAKLIRRAERGLLRARGSQAAFARRQVALSDWLRGLLSALMATALGGADALRGERLALALWLVSPDGARLTGWAHSDRAHQDPATIAPVPITATSDWVAIRTVCQGARVELDRENYASRWRFVRGLPLVLDAPSRLPVGCLTISSTKRGGDSVLTRMPADRRAALHDALVTATTEMIARASA